MFLTGTCLCFSWLLLGPPAWIFPIILGRNSPFFLFKYCLFPSVSPYYSRNPVTYLFEITFCFINLLYKILHFILFHLYFLILTNVYSIITSFTVSHLLYSRFLISSICRVTGLPEFSVWFVKISLQSFQMNFNKEHKFGSTGNNFTNASQSFRLIFRVF